MSYDVNVGDASFNMTYNVSRVFYDHIPDTGKRGGLHEIEGLTGRQAARVIGQAFNRLNETRSELWKIEAIGEPEMCKRYDAPNGWGSLVGAILFLGQLMNACIENPRSKVRIS